MLPKNLFMVKHFHMFRNLYLRKESLCGINNYQPCVSSFSSTSVLPKNGGNTKTPYRPRQPQSVRPAIFKSTVLLEDFPASDQHLIADEKEYEIFVHCELGNLFGYSSIAVIQPWVKWGKHKKRYTSPELLLEEACALVKSLPSMTVAYQEYVPLQKISKSYIFGSGSLERLVSEVRSSRAQAVFISINSLSRLQRRKMEENFCMKIFDRYNVVLAIFKHYASSTAAKLQIAMAELPCMSKNILSEKDKMMLHHREAMLTTALKKLESRRTGIRENRKKFSIPSVAIVGYTNCGKSTLIRMLTSDERAQGENRLFATVDVTAHKGVLPCGLSTLFLDTVGFIQDIPTDLIASFQATLCDAVEADLILHIRDISHPDIVAQTLSVSETLRLLPLPKDTPVIIVNNKTDLLEEKLLNNSEEVKKDDPIYKEGIYISAYSGAGLRRLLEKIQSEILKVTARKLYSMILPTGSAKIEWLKSNVGVTEEIRQEENPNNTRLITVLNEAEKAAFERAFKS